MKILLVFGTRPEAIKMAPVVRELRRRAEAGELEYRVCCTAQHREMLDQVLDIFGIVPDYDLRVMEANQTPTAVASAVLRDLEPVLRAERPDWVLVQGDTTTVAAASLAAFYARARVGHVEAGLRTHDRWQPFPEEINRRVAGVIADLHFAPTRSAAGNLLREGTDPAAVVVTGNPVVDALQWVAGDDTLRGTDEGMRAADEVLAELGDRRLVLVTAHRRENFGAPLEEICHALADLAREHGDSIRIVYPVHLNPNVSEPVRRLLGGVPGVRLLPPVDYVPFVRLLKHAYLALTDSGGIQEEAPGVGVPVLVMRDTTERPEAVEAGTARLVGARRATIVREVNALLSDPGLRERMTDVVNPYGDGRAAERIVAAVLGEPVDEFVAGPALSEALA